MSVPSYPFHSLPLKLLNKRMSFPFPPLKLPNKRNEEYSKIILFIPFHSIPFPPPKQSLTFHSFPFLYFKTSNQGYLIPFHSILFHSFPLLKYIPFLSIPLWSSHSISFHSIPLWTPKRSLNLATTMAGISLFCRYFVVSLSFIFYFFLFWGFIYLLRLILKFSFELLIYRK